MWICFAVLAVICTFSNIFSYALGKDHRLFMGLGLGFTALTLCAEYKLVVLWTQHEDWGAIMDVVPTMGSWVWIIAVVSIIVNMSPIFVDAIKNR